MNNKQYQYRSVLEFDSGGYPGEEYGPQGATTNWISTTDLSGSRLTTYYFRDSNEPSNANSSKVEITIRDTWTASISSNNTLTINADTDIISIVRTDIQGNPLTGGNATRDIIIRRYKGGPEITSWRNLNIAQAGTISSGYDLPSYSFSLAPGEDASQSTLYVINCVTGSEFEPLPSVNVDAMYMGVQFRNILPKDYRPGMTWDGSAFMSHNRDNGGVCSYWNGSAWTEMRTQDYPTGTGNPPLLYRDSGWFNQAKIGQE